MQYSKKGQIGMIETIMVLIVITLLMVVGIYFYYKTTSSSVQEDIEEFSETDVKILLTQVPHLPQVKCSENLVERECIDMGKLWGFKELIKKNLVWYKEDFGKVNLIVEQIYPEVEDVDCNQGNYPDCKTFNLFTNANGKNRKSIVVSLYDPKTKKHRMGKLIVEW